MDLIENNVHIYTDDLGTTMNTAEVPADLVDEVRTQREKMIELIVESDDELTLRYLEGEEITPDELKAALRRATIESRLVPVLCGSSLKNKGVQLLLDAVIDYLPGPLDVPAVKGIDPGQEEWVDSAHRRERAFRRSCLQNRGRPLRWSPRIYACLLGQGNPAAMY